MSRKKNRSRKPGDPLVKDASSEKQTKEAAGIEERQEARLANDMIAVLSTREGRNVIWRILQGCSAFDELWEPGEIVHYNVAKHDIGMKLIRWVESADREKWITMLSENRIGEEEDERDHGDDGTDGDTSGDTDDTDGTGEE